MFVFWGSAYNGELGLGGMEPDYRNSPTWHPYKIPGRVAQVSLGANHTIVTSRAGEVYTCGNNDFGQLGHSKPKSRLNTVEGLEACRILQVVSGGYHSMAFNDWGQLFAWGSNALGQLGMQSNELQPHPKIIRSLAMYQFVQISAGLNHSLALTNGGDLYSWGSNSYGQLGLGSDIPFEKKPSVVKALVGIPIAFIACGSNHSFAVSKSGAIYGWGKNNNGQLGLNDQVNKFLPAQLKTLRSIRVKYIACGDEFSAFLSADGGVFTCGAGNHGQLGHGTTSIEVLPRMVTELMGNTVTQISCGRNHTLAFVSSTGRLYSFGLNKGGQLGLKSKTNESTPKLVKGPWLAPDGNPAVPNVDKIENVVVKNIYAGGDRCMITFLPYRNGMYTEDYRVLEEKSQILAITPDRIAECIALHVETIVDQDLFLYLETVFRSLSCLNGSFLLNNDQHYCCSSKHHGIDFAKAEEIFRGVGRIENISVSEIIREGIIEYLIPALTSNPMDIEMLRSYLVLPLYHQFENPRNSNALQSAFAKKLLSLRSDSMKVVECWLRKTSPEYFERLIRIYKDVVAYHLRGLKAEQEHKHFPEAVLVALDALALLNKVNHSTETMKVPFDTFYLSEITEAIDIRTDYVRWLASNSPRGSRLHFCNYSFLFDAHAKTTLLQADQSLQMQTAMSQAASRLIAQMLFAPTFGLAEEQFLYLNVTRENIVQNTLDQLTHYSSSDLKKPLRVKFIGEEAEDAGGVRKEFFMLVLKEVLDPKYGMFKHFEETRTIWFSEVTFEDELMHFLIGLLCGLAIYNFTIIDLPFPLVLYKKLLNEKVTLADLKGLSPSLAKNLQDVLDYNEPDIDEVYSLSFEVCTEVYGEVRIVPLKEDGSSTPVVQHNKQEFVDLYVDFILNKSISKHFSAFYDGFHKVCGGKVLELFHPQELMTLIVGNENYDWDEFERTAEYKNGYRRNDPTIKMFWEVFHDLPLEEKKKFLLFLTGSDRIPIQGIKEIKIYIQPTNDERYLPVAHTCFNLLDLPRYATKERLKYKLCQAIKQNQGFSLV